MKDINIFCFGFGQVAKNFIKKLSIEQYNINLSATSRNKSSKKIFNGINYNSYLFNSENFDQNLVVKLKEADHILVSIPPENQEDLVVKNFSKFLESSKLKWITYLSATSIYGDHKGEWVNENSKTNPISNNGIARLKAEKAWVSLEKKNKIPVQIFRLSGIYSNEKNILIRLKSGEVKLINKKNHYFSRIHVDDISNILFKSLSKFKSGEIYNLSDDKPSTSEDVTLFGAKMLNIENIEKIEVDQIKSEMLKNFYNESKKVSNEKMKSYFNYNLKFPSYIEGLNYIRSNFI
ncbi:NAD-dependent epimerase/dehydratase family protein [Candidatus Pelagibacter ubique]|jgi:nucleoside-diphosphate-sugar epimerase|nr:NAD-dependent epimerase/dehydratase family protein [Candidatus Pelagibacter sp.]MDA7689684.1 NAD-dependent epimerase/dehydratase family protein [Candidatus Pelagibacter sp.]MDB3968624.1 NAD-dependent epimerase/dehydratase family protein [Candidatus Pelagibacter ubique]MDB4011408.1 NAD-dependent epimerase/dehydratase family protein [Candidatus Pelagibacter sp.]